MKRILPLAFFLACVVSFAQFNEDAPWMKELKKTKSSAVTTARESTQQKGYTFQEITNAFDAYWIDKDKDAKGSGYKPFMRWHNYWKHFVKPNGSLPTAKELWNTWETVQQAQGPVNPTANWTALGPVISGELNGALPGIGRINAIAVDPNDQNTWYAGAPAGGVWKTTNGGSTWTNLFDDFPQIGVSGIAIDPNNSNIVLIATGDDDASDSFSAGVFRSTDGGLTWNETSIGPATQDEFDTLNEITFDPTDSNVVWVAGTDGLQKSTDGGLNWEVMLSGNITDFKLKPDNPDTIYAVDSNSYFRSTDGGANFTEITDNLPTNGGRLVLGVSPADPEVLYVLVADIIARGSSFLGLFKSTDGGGTFNQTANTTDIFESNQAWFDMAIAVSPTDADDVYTGVLNIWRSTNGGDSFTQLNQWFQNTPSYTHADIHTLKFFDNRLFCGSDGGLFVSDDQGATFEDYSDGLAVTQFYRIGIAKNDASKIVGGTQDNSGFVFNNNEWSVYTGGDGMDYEIDPSNSNIAYGFVQFGNPLFITNNLGQGVSTVSSPNDGEASGNWITPLALDSEGTVYAAYSAVYRLVGSDWEQVSDFFAQGNNIDDLEIDPNNPLIMYAVDQGNLYRSEDGGENFVMINDVAEPFDSQISAIAINNNDSNIVYLTTSNRVGISQAQQPAMRGVYRVTVDGNTLVSRENITFDLPTEQAFFSIVHQPRNSNNPIYVGTNLGVFRLDDTLTEWEQYSTNLPITAVSDLEISPDDEVLVASTYGRGAWQSPIPVQVPDDDVKLIAITPNSRVVDCGEVFPEVVVENNGINPITQVDVEYSLNGGTIENFTFNNTINSGETATIVLPALTITELIPSELEVTVNINNDEFTDNNSQKSTFIPNQFANGDQLFDFESESNSLILYNEIGDGSVWERGVPTGTLLNSVSSGTQVLGTNLDGNHPDATTGYILSGCYEMSNILAPVLKFSMAFDLEINFDIVYVEYSTDNGLNWNLLGNINSQPNWYNSDRTNVSSGADDDCQNCPGGQWTGTDTTMTEYAYDFLANAAAGETDLTTEDNVLFRIVFQSDPFVNQEGAIVDDFRVEGFQDDEDDDNDGVLDVDDNCPLVANADQADNENDGMGDVCDEDDDNDGVLDVDDNCPLTANADQADGDGDGIGDVCDDDLDNDGVPNANDLCPDTPEGTVVDVDGCAVFSLPADNFTIKTIDESCIANDNGSIEIEAVAMFDYTATLIDSEAVATSIDFTDTGSFTNLTAGAYSLCITVDGQPGYERCFDVIISEPESLSVISKVNSLNNEVTLSLSGGKVYYIELNNELFSTSQSEITLPLKKVENVLTVRTDKDCQGTFDETILLTSQIFIYPNPVSTGALTIYLGSDEFDQVETTIFNSNGSKVFSKSFAPINNGYVNMDISGLSQGFYLLNIKTGRSLLNYKILKK